MSQTQKEPVMVKSSTRILVLVAGAGLLGGCTGVVPRPLQAPMLDRLARLQATPESAGDLVYTGRVFPLDGGTEPLYRYERRVQATGASITSTHITRDPSGSVVVVQNAVHSPAYQLTRAEMIHRQTGATAAVVVADGRATFTLNDGERESISREDVHDPVVAGATMFGFILAHWTELAGGASIPFRFAVLERGETFGFVLDRTADAAGRTTIRMKPASLVVRLAVSPTYFQFDTASRRILEYSGRVPPMETDGARLRALDARVHYTFAAASFR
jgi:hypothetical protein